MGKASAQDPRAPGQKGDCQRFSACLTSCPSQSKQLSRGHAMQGDNFVTVGSNRAAETQFGRFSVDAHLPVVQCDCIRGTGTHRAYCGGHKPRGQRSSHMVRRIPRFLRRLWRAQPRANPPSSAQGVRGENGRALCAKAALLPTSCENGATRNVQRETLGEG